MISEELPRWDLSNVYPGLESEEFKEAVSQLEAGLDELDGYLSVHGIERGGHMPVGGPAALATVLSGYLDRMNALLRTSDTLSSYVYSFFATDSYNTTARKLLSELEALEVRLERLEVLFRGWVGTASQEAELFQAALEVEGTAKEHTFYLKETARQSRYLMSTAEETLAAELSLSGSRAWERLQGVVSTQIRVPFEREGRVDELPITVLQNLRTDPDGAVRRRAYEAEMAAWERAREPLAACLNGVKGAVNTLNERRGRPDCLHRPLEQARINRETLEAMLGVMRDSFPAFRRYLRKKAELLGKDALPWWDLFAPMGRSERVFSWADARAFLLETFGSFSERLQALALRAFSERWIDAEPRDGKQGGAFCMDVLAVEESRVLCNFDGSLSQVTTLAHELGHAYHVECEAGRTPLQRRLPMTLAETASILVEMIVNDALLSRATDSGEELAIVEQFLIRAGQTVVDIYSRYLFEKEVFERRVKAELSADELCKMMLSAQQATYGDGLDGRYLNPYMWAWKPHYYHPELSFYNFPYAFGLLFSLGLYAIYQERGKSFLPEYDELLRRTGEGTSAKLAARFGIAVGPRRSGGILASSGQRGGPPPGARARAALQERREEHVARRRAGSCDGAIVRQARDRGGRGAVPRPVDQSTGDGACGLSTRAPCDTKRDPGKALETGRVRIRADARGRAQGYGPSHWGGQAFTP
jgi:pepF/M3 family oligoendopeptidase